MNKKINSTAKILITGATGFIGSHLIEKLLLTTKNIYVPYIAIEENSYFAINNFQKKVKMKKLDLRQKEKVIDYIKVNKIDYIIHLAAQTIVTDALNDPYYTIENNIISTLNILEAARTNAKIKGVIIASSDKAYGKTKNTYTEDSPLKGDHPYDVSKSAKDLIALTYYKTYNTPVVVTRFGNVYGEGDLHFSRIIPGICEAICKRKLLKIRSNGKYIRDYIYVKDVVNGYIHLLNNLDTTIGNAFNFSSNDTFSVLELIDKAENIIGKKIKYTIKNSAKNEIPYQHLDDKKVRKTGWKPSYDINTTFPTIVEWYKKYAF